MGAAKSWAIWYGVAAWTAAIFSGLELGHGVFGVLPARDELFTFQSRDLPIALGENFASLADTQKAPRFSGGTLRTLRWRLNSPYLLDALQLQYLLLFKVNR